MTTKRFGMAMVAIVIVALFGAVLGIVYSYFATGVVIDDRVYTLAYTYKTNIKGSSVEGRVFDFADRNLPRTSILVPVRDARGIALVREIPTMAPSTIRKMRIRVPAVKMEGVTYPAYEYIEWQYHLGTREPQSVIPTVIPKR